MNDLTLFKRPCCLPLIGMFGLIFMVNSGLFAQDFVNGGLERAAGSITGPTTGSAITGWDYVPFTSPACNATFFWSATADVLDASGPVLSPSGIYGTPHSGQTFMSGIYSTNGTMFWHEGMQQTVDCFMIGETYEVRFYQAVVKQINHLDQSGSWNVFVDNTLIATTAPSTSTLAFNDANLQWDLRTVTFTATANSHTIQFMPADDDGNLMSSTTDITGALRMGLDSVSIVPPSVQFTTPSGLCSTSPDFNITASPSGGTWSGTGVTNGGIGTFSPATSGIGLHTVTYSLTYLPGCTLEDSLVVTINPCTLPVEFGELSAEEEQNGIRLHWNTLSEINSSHFIIERVTDEGFEWLAEIDAQGTTQSETIYTLLDERPARGVSYYRLTGVDLDGSISYTGTVSAHWNLEVDVYPNPANDLITINTCSNSNKIIHLISAEGKIIETVEADKKIIKRQVQHLPDGVYRVQVKDIDGIRNTIFIKRS